MAILFAYLSFIISYCSASHGMNECSGLFLGLGFGIILVPRKTKSGNNFDPSSFRCMAGIMAALCFAALFLTSPFLDWMMQVDYFLCSQNIGCLFSSIAIQH